VWSHQVSHESERRVRLHLAWSSSEHKKSACFGERNRGPEQHCLPDPRVANQHDGARLGRGTEHCVRQNAEFRLSADQAAVNLGIESVCRSPRSEPRRWISRRAPPISRLQLSSCHQSSLRAPANRGTKCGIHA
jgi:hypothetical protein